MPRFENEGFEINKNRKNNYDRTVPDDENYYGTPDVDLNFNNKNRSEDIIKDNQKRKSDEIYNTFSNQRPPRQYNPGQNGGSGSAQSFRSETREDFEPAKNPNQRRTQPSGRGSDRKDRPKKKKNGKSGKLSKGKKALIIILVIILVIAGLAVPILARIDYDDKKDDEYVNSSELADSSMVKNILLLGVDARSGDEDEASRSDTMMLVSVDTKHHCIKLVSFLRDTWVYIPSLGYEQRLNAACSSGGYHNVVETIEYNFGIQIDSYVVTDFEMFQVLVDSIGGVEIEVTAAEANEVTKHKKRYGNVTLEEGKQLLTGEQALAYCRIRKIDTDFARTERQRTVMTAILKKALSNPAKLYKMAFNSAPYIETDMGRGELLGFVGSAALCVSSIHQTSIPFDGTWNYATINGNSVISIDLDRNKELLHEYIFDLSSRDIEKQSEND